MKFDHDFIGAEALKKVGPATQRKKVTFAWNADDVTKVFRSMLEPEPRAEHYKYIDLQISSFESSSYAKVMHGSKMVGVSMFSGYSYNERSMLSLGTVDPDTKVGTELTLVSGEPNGGTEKPTVERHKKIEIRVVVCSVSYSKVTRGNVRGRLALQPRSSGKAAQRLFSTFAGGWPGTGLLPLRLGITVLLIHFGIVGPPISDVSTRSRTTVFGLSPSTQTEFRRRRCKKLRPLEGNPAGAGEGSDLPSQRMR